MKSKYKIKREFTELDGNFNRRFQYELYIYEDYYGTFHNIDELKIYLEEYERAYIITGETAVELIDKVREIDG